MPNQLKQLLYSATIFAISLIGIAWIVSLAQLPEAEKTNLIHQMLTPLSFNHAKN
jgi:hypothetical protein